MSRRWVAAWLSLVLVVFAFPVLQVQAASHSSSPTTSKQWGKAQSARVGNIVPKRLDTAQVVQDHAVQKHVFVPQMPGPRVVTANVTIPHTGAVQITAPKQGKQPHTVGYNGFYGLGENGSEPSDANADIGPYNVVETVNTAWAIYDRSGHQQYTTSFQKWFGGNAFDPVVEYDPWGGRFFLLVDNGSNIQISVAQQTNALGRYCTYTYNEGDFIDFPRLGFDVTGVYFTANMYPSQGSVYTNLYQLDRVQMENCQTANFWKWDHVKDSSNKLVYTLVPAFKYNYYSTHNEEYLVNQIFGGGCSLTIWKIANHLLYNNSVSTQCYTPPPDAAQKGSSGTIAASANAKTVYQATFRDGLLDVAMGSSYDWGNGKIRSIVSWFEIDPVNNKVVRQGRFGNPDYWYFFPTMQQESNGKVAFVLNASGSTIYPSIWYLGMEASGTYQNLVALAWGQSYYGSNGSARWGDYQSARLDPTNWSHVWICGQYASATNTWGTAIGNIAAS